MLFRFLLLLHVDAGASDADQLIPTDTHCLNWLFGCFGLWTCLFEAAMLNSHYARHYQADENGVHESLDAKTICNMLNPFKSEMYVIVYPNEQ